MHTFSRAVLRVPLERERRTQDLRNAPGLSYTAPRRERLIGIEDFADRSDARRRVRAASRLASQLSFALDSASSTLRTLRAKLSGVNGFCRKAEPGVRWVCMIA